VILELQDELRCLEDDLEEIDLENQGPDCQISRKDDQEHADALGQDISPRSQIIEIIRTKLVNYGKILLPPTTIIKCQLMPKQTSY
jgi:hypothetical protein